MSSDLWAGSKNGEEVIFLDMNAHGTLFLTIVNYLHDDYQKYSFVANKEGLQEAQELIDTISDWIQHQKKI